MKHKFRLDHFSILVSDVARSVTFYTGVFGFEIAPRADSSTTQWLTIGGMDTIHISQGDTRSTHLEKDTHFAMRVESLDDFLADITKKGIPYFDWPGNENAIGYRFDGFRQVYIRDPDGYWIEVNDHN